MGGFAFISLMVRLSEKYHFHNPQKSTLAHLIDYKNSKILKQSMYFAFFAFFSLMSLMVHLDETTNGREIMVEIWLLRNYEVLQNFRLKIDHFDSFSIKNIYKPVI